MKVKWFGQAAFLFVSEKGLKIITDPYDPAIGYGEIAEASDIATISHEHGDHNYIAGLKGEPQVVRGAGSQQVKELQFKGIATFHDNDGGQKLGENTVYLMEIDELSVCHLGDLGHVVTDEQVEELGDIDVLMVPVGGKTTIDAQAAAEMVRKLEPKAVIPMHYKTEAVTMVLDPVDRFLKEIGVNGITPQPKLLLSKSNLPQSTQVFLLQY